jgi:hypothetical protein
VVLLHDLAEETDGDRTRQREGWPAGDSPLEARHPQSRHLNELMIHRAGGNAGASRASRRRGASPEHGVSARTRGAADQSRRCTPAATERRDGFLKGARAMLFDSWTGLGRVLVVGTSAYVALVLILRVSGKRTLSKLNAFDLIVTVALGSTLATVLLSKDVALAEGVLALALLVSLQFAIAWLSVRSQRFQSLVKAEPALLMRQGCFLGAAMRRERITREEVLAAVREHGGGDLSQIEAVVLETDGSLTVVSLHFSQGVLLGGTTSRRRGPG